MSTIYMIRHGQASFGKRNYDILSEKGKRQAEYLAEYLSEYLDNTGIKFDVIYTGSQIRHMQTAQPFIDLLQKKGDLPLLKEHSGLAEYDFESMLKKILPIILSENKSLNADISNMFSDDKTFQRVFEDAVIPWLKKHDHESKIPTWGIPAWQEFKLRVNAGLEEITAKEGRGKHVAIFTSGGPIALAMQRALQFSDEIVMKLSWQIVNCSVSSFKYSRGSIMVSTLNEHNWLAKPGRKDMVTYR